MFLAPYLAKLTNCHFKLKVVLMYKLGKNITVFTGGECLLFEV